MAEIRPSGPSVDAGTGSEELGEEDIQDLETTDTRTRSVRTFEERLSAEVSSALKRRNPKIYSIRDVAH
jgi:hypothetical protein